MNIYLQYFILGLTQGMTEFLPISSSGHLYLLQSMGVGTVSLLESLLLHLSTLLIVIIVFRKKIWFMIKNPTDNQSLFVIIASIPTAILAGIIRYLLPDTNNLLPFMFIVTSVFLVLPSIIKKDLWRIQKDGLVKNAIIVGVSQGLACFNGISRSGATTSTMRMLGMDSQQSAEICFILSIPIILGSTVVEILTTKSMVSSHILPLILAMVVAFVSGLFAIKAFVKILKRKKLWVFAIYTFLLGIASFFILK